MPLLYFCIIAPSSPPTITTSFVIDSRSIAIQWIPPPSNTHNGIIRKYIVYITAVGSNVTKTQEFTGTVAIIGSLLPSHTYQFSVAAYTVSNGPGSTLVNLSLPEDGWFYCIEHFLLCTLHSFQVDILNNYLSMKTTPYSLTLSWTPPPSDEQKWCYYWFMFINVTHADTLQNYPVLFPLTLT